MRTVCPWRIQRRVSSSSGGMKAFSSAWSRPFDKPESGKIAMKVINHYGDEVLKVFQI